MKIKYLASTTTTFSNIIISNYSDELTNSSEKYPGTDKYYQAIQIMVNTTGTYTLSSISGMDSYGCLYQDTFNPFNLSTNQLLCNDDSVGNQFKITYNLTVGVSYILIFTTYASNITGSFTVVGSGQDNVYFTSIYIQQTTTASE
jgi:hypothetical protein